MAELLEARYQRALFQGSEEVLRRDFELRYGSKWRDLMEASEGANERDVEEAERRAPELSALVSSRINDEKLATLYAKYGRDLSLEAQLRLGLDLLGVPGALEELLRWGLAIHYSDDVVASPSYLAGLLARLMANEYSVYLDLNAEVGSIDDPKLLALLEGEAAGDADWGLYELVYGQRPQTTLRIGRLAYYDPHVGLVVNPVTYPDEVLESLLSLKERRARKMASLLGLHGEYEFDRRARCGVAYLSYDGTAGGSAEVYICPWLAPPISLTRARGVNKVYVVWGPPPAEGLRTRHDMFIFLYEDGATVFHPYRGAPVHEHIVDLLYRSGIEVTEA
ncbi:hypothetical protein [Thermoproteus tenax]|uniref:Uncharacterized protein n=1 Tax=Thermoproteus tenax (strain ATCC 35583 / DSM 2078 / JCM 9277 / NBRC 100435 / Kra 1) TaxID=768679 RepID=G4RKJ9_THETK|nr:hypothetical protein [Thermoproteus tenax]CCC82094.1 hypothetical protein TTX_1464 [Thermoproteus tenax Kra 1]